MCYRCGTGPAKEGSEAQMSVVLAGQRNVGKSRREELGHPIQPVSHWHTLGIMGVLRSHHERLNTTDVKECYEAQV